MRLVYATNNYRQSKQDRTQLGIDGKIRKTVVAERSNAPPTSVGG